MRFRQRDDASTVDKASNARLYWHLLTMFELCRNVVIHGVVLGLCVCLCVSVPVCM